MQVTSTTTTTTTTTTQFSRSAPIDSGDNHQSGRGKRGLALGHGNRGHSPEHSRRSDAMDHGPRGRAIGHQRHHGGGDMRSDTSCRTSHCAPAENTENPTSTQQPSMFAMVIVFIAPVSAGGAPVIDGGDGVPVVGDESLPPVEDAELVEEEETGSNTSVGGFADSFPPDPDKETGLALVAFALESVTAMYRAAAQNG